jgi:hypothetical protein
MSTVLKKEGERVRADDLKPFHPMNGMAHDSPEWSDLDGRLTGLQSIPVPLQLTSCDW